MKLTVKNAHENQTLTPLKRIPVRSQDKIILLSVDELVSVVAHKNLLSLTTANNECLTIDFRLNDLELRLDGAKFIRLSRSTLVNLDFVAYFTPLAGGRLQVTLENGQQFVVSRGQSHILRETLFRL